MMVKIAPSILSADFGRLAEQLGVVEEAGADLIHIDVMDGHFVPNLTFGPLVVRKCRELTSLPLDVHLMIANAEEHLEGYLDAGANYLCLHVEAVRHLQRALARIREAGARAGVALNPSTPPAAIEWVLSDLDFVLVMSVNPGFEAQPFIPASLDKISATRELIERRGAAAAIEVDGGVDADNAAELVRAGATMLVAGSAVFNTPDPAAAVRRLREAADGALRV